MHSAERFHTFCNFKQLHCLSWVANQLTYTLPISTKLLHCYFLFNRTVANIAKRSLKDCLITQNGNNRIFLTRMCLQVHVNVHITAECCSVQEAKAVWLDLSFQETGSRMLSSALTALLNHSYLVMAPIAYFLDSSVIYTVRGLNVCISTALTMYSLKLRHEYFFTLFEPS